MRVLAHIHTFNDEDVIDRSVGALLDQTYALEEILIVDNGSTDGTLAKSFARPVTVIRHLENRGTSGAVITGFKYAMDNEYEWIWILDADSAPHKDALMRLVEVYESFPDEVRREVRTLSVGANDYRECPSIVFIDEGYRHVIPDPKATVQECDATVWSGSLFKLEAVKRIGLPSEDYFLDWGEYEYGYRGMMRGYRAFMCQASRMEHNTGVQGRLGKQSHVVQDYRFGRVRFKMPNLPAIRLYYVYRNTTYFWLYVYRGGSVRRTLRRSLWMAPHLLKLLLTVQARPEAVACLRGLLDGVLKQMQHRY